MTVSGKTREARGKLNGKSKKVSKLVGSLVLFVAAIPRL